MVEQTREVLQRPLVEHRLCLVIRTRHYVTHCSQGRRLHLHLPETELVKQDPKGEKQPCA